MNRPEINPQSNLSFSYHRNKSFRKTDYGHGFELCYGWQRLASAITKVVWSPSVFFTGKRLEKDFAFSDFMVLDFDSGKTISEIAKAFRDSAYLIAPTKSHLVEKKGITCERFRLVVPWEKRITDLATYRASIAHYITQYEADQACKDGARFFWPSTTVSNFQEPHYDIELATVRPGEPEQKYAPRINQHTGERILPNHIMTFLTCGHTFGAGRNISVFITAKELFSCGQNEHEIIDLIKGAPFERTGFSDRELENTVRSAGRC